MKFEIQKLTLAYNKSDVDVGNRKMELERQFFEMQKSTNQDLTDRAENEKNAARRFEMEKQLWEGEKNDLLRKMKDLNRKIEEYQDEIRLLDDQNQTLKNDKITLLAENENNRNELRDQIANKSDLNDEYGSSRKDARDTYAKSFMQREV